VTFLNICKDFGMSLQENEQQGQAIDGQSMSEVAYFATGCFWGAEEYRWRD
jgi:hypothetical protein